MKGKMEVGLWVYGLVSAFIGGGAGAFTAGPAVAMIDPEKFNLSHPWPLFMVMAAVFVASGLTPFFAYLKQNPLPPIVVTETTTTTLQTNPPAIVEIKTTETKPSEEQPK